MQRYFQRNSILLVFLIQLTTFSISSHEWTDYGQVQTLHSRGHEIASHGITHSFGEKFSKNQWLKEVNGQREILHLYGGVPLHEIRGELLVKAFDELKNFEQTN